MRKPLNQLGGSAFASQGTSSSGSSRTFRLRIPQSSDSSNSPIREDTKLALCCVFGFAIAYAILYPGFMTNDSAMQLVEARRGTYSDWHPPVMAWIWRWIDLVLPGSAGMLMLQLGLMWIGLYLAISAIVPGSATARFAFAVMLFLLPPVLGWAGAITKDTLLMGAALAATGTLLRAAHLSPRDGTGVYWISATIGFLSLVAALRHNGVFLISGLALTGFLMARVHRERRRAWQMGLLVLIVPVALGQGASRLLTDERSWPVASLFALDIAGIAVRNTDDPEFVTRHGNSITQALLRPGHTLAELNEQYRADDWLYLTRPRPPASEGPVSFHWNEERTRALGAVWRELVQRYPLAYLAGRAETTSILLGIGSRPLVDPVCFSSARIAKRWSSILGSPPERPELQKILGWRLEQVIQNTLLFRPWFAFALAALLLLATAVRASPGRPLVAGLLISGLMHETALFVLSPAAEYRYSGWLFVSLALALLALGADLRRRAPPGRQL